MAEIVHSKSNLRESPLELDSNLDEWMDVICILVFAKIRDKPILEIAEYVSFHMMISTSGFDPEAIAEDYAIEQLLENALQIRIANRVY